VRILHMSADFLWPPRDGGRVRSMAQLRVLSSLPEVERIHMFCLCEEDVRREEREALMREVPKLEILEPVFHPVHLFRHPRYVPWVVLLRVLRGIPYMAAKWDSSAVRRALRRELAGRTFDVVWLNGLGMAYYVPLVRRLLPDARVVLDQHNVESDRFAQFAERQHGLRRLVAEAEWRAARRYEQHILRAVDAVGAICASDARAYRELAGIEARVVPQVAPIPARVGEEGSAPQLCYTGNLSWEPNARGVDWFCREVWPRIHQRLPEATLEIAGGGLPTDARGVPIAPPAWRAPGITMLGFVEDLSPVYERSVAMVAPMLGATGISIKLIEAFRRGMPVVTTPDGASGLEFEPGREAFVESEPDAFAARVVEVATSADVRARLRAAAYAFLEEHHQLSNAQAAVRELIGQRDTSAIENAPAPLVAGSREMREAATVPAKLSTERATPR
jgi:glycosyltransferase involved in cell wall biosynthesis